MGPDQERALLPIACTLSPDDGVRRRNDWEHIASLAFAGRKRTPGKLTMHFRDEPTVAVELKRLVAAERDCCSFLGWALARAGDGWDVEVTGDDAALKTLSFSE